MILLISTIILVFLLKSLDFLYLFQTKEYRLDRILSFFKEENPVNLLYFRKIRFPAITIRNFLVAQGNFINAIPLYLLIKNLNPAMLFIILLSAPVIALITMLLGVLLSGIPSQIYRKIIISKATKLVNKSRAVFIGITGSFGKTSTKEFLFQILAQKYRVAKTDKNYNSEVGVAISILKNLKANTDFFIAELGAYKKGEIKTICQFIRPKYAILTGIGNQHLSLFGSKKKLYEAKAELLESLPKAGIAFINHDIKNFQYFADKTKAKQVFYSLNNLLFPLNTNLPGEHTIKNLLPCIAIATQLGIEKRVIEDSIKNLKPVPGRLFQKIGIKNSTILDDSYNSNTDGFVIAIKTGSKMKFQKKYIISRGLVELGEEKKPSYQRIIKTLDNSDLILLTTDILFKNLSLKDNVMFFQSEKQLLNYLKEEANKDSLIIIEGRFEPNILNVLFANN